MCCVASHRSRYRGRGLKDPSIRRLLMLSVMCSGLQETSKCVDGSVGNYRRQLVGTGFFLSFTDKSIDH